MFVVIAFMSMGYALVDGMSLSISGSGIALMQEGIFMTEASYLDDSGAVLEESKINSAEGTVLNSTIKLSETDVNSYITYRITLYNNYSYDCFFEEAVFDSKFYDNENITFEMNNNLLSGMKLPTKSYVTFDLTFKYISGVTPSKEISVLNSYINFNFDSVAIVQSTKSTDKTAFRSSTYKAAIKNITFEDEINIPSDAIESWDIGVSQTGDVMAYVVKNTSDENYYDLYIQSDTQLYANENMSFWFYNMTYVDSLNGLELLDTSMTTNMESMFDCFGYNSSKLTLDVSSLDTSNVTNMSGMFRSTGYKAQKFTLNITGLETGNVTNMSYMFHQTGCTSTVLLLDVSGFDTSKVTNMNGMFRYAGYQSTVLELDVSKFNTSLVTSMASMFYAAGHKNTNFKLDVSGFDTSNVTGMDSMFFQTGYKSTVLELDVSGFNTSKVTRMDSMFYGAGRANESFTLDVSGFDTSKVTSMAGMFHGAGYVSTAMTINVSNFITSKVTNMSDMFREFAPKSRNLYIDVSGFDMSNVTTIKSMFMNCGNSSTVLNYDIAGWNTTKVTDMSYAFYNAGVNNSSFALDVSKLDTSSVTNMSNMFYGTGKNASTFSLDVSNFITGKVTDMSSMFYKTGYSNPNFTLDVSGFDTSSVTNMSEMFYEVGYNSTVLELDVSGFNTSKVTNMTSMFYNAGYSSSKINTNITIMNPNITSYDNMFFGFVLDSNSKIIVNFIDSTSDIVDLLIATKSTNSNVIKGGKIIPIGMSVSIENERFNVIEVSDDEVILLSQYNIGSNYKQSTTAYNKTFASAQGWSVIDDNMEIDIQEYTENPKLLVNEYVSYLKTYVSEPITGDLITLNKLKELDCIADTYDTLSSDYTCAYSKYASWLINGQYWWTKSMFLGNLNRVWLVYNTGKLNPIGYTDSRGIRPVITISLDAFNGLISN